MAFDPKREDYQRLALRFAHELDAGDPMIAARSFASFGRRFAQDRDSLPQSDSDRAFHLVTLATDLISEHGLNIAKLALGHRDIATTAIYDMTDRNAMQNIFSKKTE